VSAKDRHRADGSLRLAEMKKKKKAIINLVGQIPDDLSRGDSDTMKVVARLLAGVHHRAMNRPAFYAEVNRMLAEGTSVSLPTRCEP
jgi:hypothetical protein